MRNIALQRGSVDCAGFGLEITQESRYFLLRGIGDHRHFLDAVVAEVQASIRARVVKMLEL